MVINLTFKRFVRIDRLDSAAQVKWIGSLLKLRLVGAVSVSVSGKCF